MKVKLVVVGGYHAGQEIAVCRAMFLIGRDKDCQLRALGCNRVSRRHCVIRLEKERIIAEDLHSTNGTFINGEEIEEPHELRHGDHLRLGACEFEVHSLDAVASERKPAMALIREVISELSVSAPTNNGIVTGPEIGIDLQKLDAVAGGEIPARSKSSDEQQATRSHERTSVLFGPTIICGEDTTDLNACETRVEQEGEAVILRIRCGCPRRGRGCEAWVERGSEATSDQNAMSTGRRTASRHQLLLPDFAD